jgi:hypothetical protein
MDKDFSFYKILIAIIIGWVIIQLWANAVQVFFYTFVGLSKDSTFDTFCVAIFVTLVLILMLEREDDVSDKIKSEMSGLIITNPGLPDELVPH